jgi:hypothetical protein
VVQEDKLCGVCGGGGRIEAGSRGTTACPACRGLGSNYDDELYRDKTTMPSRRDSTDGKKPDKITWPTTFGGKKLADEVKASNLSAEDQARLTQKIIDYEGNKGEMTKTFARLVRKEIRAAG